MRASFASVVLVQLLSFCLIASFAVQPAKAQAVRRDTAFVELAAAKAIEHYREAVGTNAHLFTGVEYFDYRKLLREGHQFWETDELQKGDILYEGIWYYDIPMLYDVVKDEVVIKTENRAILQKLIPEKIAQFKKDNHTFIRLTADSLGIYRTGFYDLLFQKNVQVLVRRTKIIEEVPQDNLVKMVFRQADSYLILKDQTYYQVTSKRSFYAAFKDKRKDLQKYYRSNHLKFRKDKENTIVALATYYETL